MDSEEQSNNFPSPKEVVQALREAGWLLEQDTETALKDYSFHTFPGKAYADPDDPRKSREIDVMGYREIYRNESLSYSIGARVIVECKQSTMPYALIGRPQDPRDKTRPRKEEQYIYDAIHIGNTTLDAGRQRQQVVNARNYPGLSEVPSAPWNDDFVATQMTRLDRKKKWLADNRGIFDSLIFPLAKALEHFRGQGPRIRSGKTITAPANQTLGLKSVNEWGK